MSLSKKELSDKYTLLRGSIRRRDLTIARELLLNNAPVNPLEESHCNTPLHWAAQRINDIDFINMLLDKGANILAINQNNKTPLQIAIAYNKEIVAKSLIDRGAYIQEEDLELLITKAAMKENPNFVKLFMDYADNANIPVNLVNAINKATRTKNLEVLRCLLHHYKSQNFRNREIINNILMEKDLMPNEIVHHFQRGSKINPENEKNLIFVYLAVEKKYLDIVKDILDFRIDVNKINKSTGQTLLHVACINRDIEMVQLLIQYKANLNIKISEIEQELKSKKIYTQPSEFIGKTALFIAVYQFDVKITDLLLKNGADVKEEPDILNIAVSRSTLQFKHLKVDIINILLNYNADVNIPDESGDFPLHIIAIHDWTDDLNKYKTITTILIKHGADVNCKNLNGQTPLHLALQQVNAISFEFLLSQGANINSMCNKNKTVMDYLQNKMNQIGSNLLYWRRDYAKNLIRKYNIIVEHMIKLRRVKLEFNEQIVYSIERDQAFLIINNLIHRHRLENIQSASQIEEQCDQEIEALKSEKIGFFTVYNFLIKDLHNIAKLVKNQQIIKALQSENFQNKFPLYLGIIKYRFSKAVKRSIVLETAQQYSLTTIFRKLPLICINEIFSYLDFADLNLLINTIQKYG